MFERSARGVRINIGPNWVPTCNFALINTEGMEAFAREQSKLLSPNLIASTSDYRGAVIGAWRLVWLEEPDGAGSVHKVDLQEQAAEAVTHLAFYAGWPNVFSALPVMKNVFEKRPR